MGYEIFEEDCWVVLLEWILKFDCEIVMLVFFCGVGGFYVDDECKWVWYREYFEYFVNLVWLLLERLEGIREDDYVKEMIEFVNCVKIFKFMIGFMVLRFMIGKLSMVIVGSDGLIGDKELVLKLELKVKDVVEEVVWMGMFGKMMRLI